MKNEEKVQSIQTECSEMTAREIVATDPLAYAYIEAK